MLEYARMPIMAHTTKIVRTSAEKSQVKPFAYTIANNVVNPEMLFIMTPPYICHSKNEKSKLVNNQSLPEKFTSVLALSLD